MADANRTTLRLPARYDTEICEAIKRTRLRLPELIAILWERSRDYINSLPAIETANTKDEPQEKQNA